MHLLLSALGLVAIGAAVFVGATGMFARWKAPEPPSRGLDTMAWGIREWAASVSVLPLLVFGMTPAPPPRPGSGSSDDVPVLLVHGYDMNRATMWPLALYLRTRGWKWVHSVNHGPWGNPVAAHARHLAVRVAELKRASGADRVDVVAHSMGGLITAFYAARMDGARDIRRLVTIGTPWKGTWLAYFGHRAEARDLEPESAVVTELSSICPRVVPVTSIWTPCDQIVVPARNSVIDHADCVEIPIAGHLDLLIDGRVFTAVRDALRAPKATA